MKHLQTYHSISTTWWRCCHTAVPGSSLRWRSHAEGNELSLWCVFCCGGYSTRFNLLWNKARSIHSEVNVTHTDTHTHHLDITSTRKCKGVSQLVMQFLSALRFLCRVFPHIIFFKGFSVVISGCCVADWDDGNQTVRRVHKCIQNELRKTWNVYTVVHSSNV